MVKQAVITGGAIRVGKALSLAMATNGYEVIIIYNSSNKEAQSLKREIENNGQKAYIYQCDISKVGNINTVFDEVFSNHKNIELLINNSSIFERKSFLETEEEFFDSHFNINLKAPFFITQKFAKYCKELNYNGNFNVINIIDSYITTNTAAYFAYLMSKKSLADFTKMVALELAPNIRVNAISPGMILPSEGWGEEKIEKKTSNMPLGKKPKLEDITNAALYLNDNISITGNNIFIDSGMQLR